MFSVSLTISVVGVASLKKLSSLDARLDHSRYYVVWLLMIFFQLMLIIVPTLLKIEELEMYYCFDPFNEKPFPPSL